MLRAACGWDRPVARTGIARIEHGRVRSLSTCATWALMTPPWHTATTATPGLFVTMTSISEITRSRNASTGVPAPSSNAPAANCYHFDPAAASSSSTGM